MANLMFVTDSVNSAATVTAENSQTTHPIYNLLDYNIHTYWESTNTSNVKITAQYAANKSANRVILYHALPTNTTVTIHTSPNNLDWTAVSNTHTISSSNTPILVIPITVSTSHLYWRVSIASLGGVTAKVYLLYIDLYYEITTRYNYGSDIGEYDYGGISISESFGGVRRANETREKRQIWRFKYDLWGSGDFPDTDKWDSIIDDCNGKQFPMFFIDENSVTHYVRFMQDKLGKVETAHEIYIIPSILLEQEL